MVHIHGPLEVLLAHRWIDRNLTRLELVISILLIAMTMGIFMKYVNSALAAAEKTMVATTVMNLDTALRYHAMINMLRNKPGILNVMLTQSPFAVVQVTQQQYLKPENIVERKLEYSLKRLMATPANYVGEVIGSDSQDLSPGDWYFDIQDRTLNYLVRNRQYFQSGIEGFPGIKLKVTLIFKDMNGDSEYQHGIDRYITIKLEAIGDYHWTV